jgi:hypothetical protein
MNNESKSGRRRLPKPGLSLAIGIGVGIAFAMASLPNWRLVLGWAEFGVIFGLVAAIVQTRRPGR